MTNSWENKIEVKKGNYGEKLIVDILEEHGWNVYGIITPGAHAYDFHMMKGSSFYNLDVKTQDKMLRRNETGIAVKHYDKYLKSMEDSKLDFLLFFVDPASKAIFSGKLSELRVETAIDGHMYPRYMDTKNGSRVTWNMKQLHKVRNLSTKELSDLEAFNTHHAKKLF